MKNIRLDWCLKGSRNKKTLITLYLYPSSEDLSYLVIDGCSCNQESNYTSYGCKDNFPKWPTRRRYSHASAWRICYARIRKETMQDDNILIRIKANTQAMAWQILKNTHWQWIQIQWRRHMCLFKDQWRILCDNLFVDGILIFRTDLCCVEDTKRFLLSVFDMKDLGAMEVILIIKIIRDDDEIVISQSNYIEKIFKRFDMFKCGMTPTPVNTNLRLMENNGDHVSQSQYQYS